MDYDNRDGIVTISFDDGKANVVGNRFVAEMNAALDRAESETAGAVILRGREGLFSAGFDLKEFEKGMAEGLAMVRGGFALLVRLYSFPLPLIGACTGHGVAMGAFILMACDYRIGLRGDFKLTLPETKISMDLPPILMALTASRIAPQHLNRVALMAEVYSPDCAVDAGFLDESADPEDFGERCEAIAKNLAKLPRDQYAKNKLAVRAATLAVMRNDLASMGEN